MTIKAAALEQNGPNLRNARRDDVLDILRWRNDDLTRAMSRNSEPIEEGAHRTWYEQVLVSHDKCLMIGELHGIGIGMVRFDRIDPTSWEVSIMLAPEARGRKVSRGLLAVGISAFAAEHGACALRARIKKINEPSLHLFRSVGFSQTEDGELTTHVLLIQ